MRWVVILLMCLLAAVTQGCNGKAKDWDLPQATPDEPLVPEPLPLVCNGGCFTGPPATYTGPSLFWLGSPPMVPVCPSDTPHQGREGFVNSPMVPEYARECLITPSDICETEGETCAPLGHEDFYLCIHKAGDGLCPPTDDYPIRKVMVDIDTDETIRLCCRILPLE